MTRHHDATSYHGPHHEGTQVVKDWIRVPQEASRPLPKTEGKEVRRMHPAKYLSSQLSATERLFSLSQNIQRSQRIGHVQL